VKAGPQIETWQGRSAALFTPAVILVISLPEAEGNTEPGISAGLPAAAMSGLRRTEPWSMADDRVVPPGGPERMHLGAARDLSAVREDLHDLAGLASARRAFQLALPTTGL
jgi:hypothetical protein